MKSKQILGVRDEIGEDNATTSVCTPLVNSINIDNKTVLHIELNN